VRIVLVLELVLGLSERLFEDEFEDEDGWLRNALIQRPPIPLHGDHERNHGEQGDLPEFPGRLAESVALEENAADDPQEVRQRQELADHLRPARHAS
jgi:hypothetical protein